MSANGNPRGGCIQARYAWASEQYRLSGKRLRQDGTVRRLLAELRERVAASRASMLAAGLVEACRVCEEQEGGSCCGRGMEAHYDGVLLLINRMLGAAVETEWRDPKSCLFLGFQGCRLPARDHICVNYLCLKVRDRLSPPAVAEMRSCQGRELDTLFRLTDYLTNLLPRLHAERGSGGRG